jgi:hypothetical protein
VLTDRAASLVGQTEAAVGALADDVKSQVEGLATRATATAERGYGQMSLELAILSEQKLAKVIQLLEESRRDNPLLDNRVDASANAMAMPADPLSLSHIVKRKRNHADTA